MLSWTCVRPSGAMKACAVRSTARKSRFLSRIQTSPISALSKPRNTFQNSHYTARSLLHLNFRQRVAWRAYCDDALEENVSLEKEPIVASVEPLQWDSGVKLPDLLSKRAIQGLDRGLNVQALLERANERIRKTLAYSFQMGPDAPKTTFNDEKILVVYDTHCLLSRILAQAYGTALDSKKTLMVDFDATTVPQLKATIDKMKEGDMVVLVQSNGFRLNDYRLRIELFKVGIKNLEHAHLDMMPNSQIPTYIDTLGFVPSSDNLKLAHGLKHLMDNENYFVIRSKGGAECIYECGLEPSLLNVGDYTGMKGVGGTFPVGEVFSEPKELERVNGEFMVFGYPNTKFEMQHLTNPFKIKIQKGQVVQTENAPKSFLEILDTIRGTEAEEGGGILIREFGVGLNPFIGRNMPLQNVTAFERQAGFHISLGRKHTVFKKSGISPKRSRFHIDVFVDLEEIQMGNKIVFKNDRFVL